MTTLSLDPVEAGAPQPVKARSPWFGRAVWLSLTFLLCATNILTLLDQDFRNGAYDLVVRIAASRPLQTIGLSEIAKAVEERKPALLEKKAVERATARLIESNAGLLRDVVDLKNDRAALAAERKILKKEIGIGRALLASHKDRIAKLGFKVLGRASRNVTRHLVSLPGHALPVLSATVAVASTALDVNDACDSLKELDELNESVGLPPGDRSKVCGVAVPTPEELLEDAGRNWKTVYQKSADALNSGAQILPRSPPSISFEFAREWLSGTFGR